MARSARFIVPRLPVHIIQRGNNRSRVFADAQDQACYREAMFRSARRAGCAVHAYVLMTNHVHMLITPTAADSAARMMRRLGSIYVRRFNDRHERTGTLWEGRFRSILVQSNLYFLACSRYIELNPVTARMAADPSGYGWSSYGHNALGREEPELTPHRCYLELGTSDAERRAAYKELFRERIPDATRELLRRPGIAGDDEFRTNVAALLRRPARNLEHGGARRGVEFHAQVNQ